MTKFEDFKKYLDKRDVLEALAEESSELTQAAVKCIRAEGLSNHVTPISVDKAYDNLNEEIDDVIRCLYMLKLYTDKDIKIPTEEEIKYNSSKTDRLISRLEKEQVSDNDMPLPRHENVLMNAIFDHPDQVMQVIKNCKEKNK